LRIFKKNEISKVILFISFENIFFGHISRKRCGSIKPNISKNKYSCIASMPYGIFATHHLCRFIPGGN
jgi:hypothetical protein